MIFIFDIPRSTHKYHLLEKLITYKKYQASKNNSQILYIISFNSPPTIKLHWANKIEKIKKMMKKTKLKNRKKRNKSFRFAKRTVHVLRKAKIPFYK